MKSRPKRTRKHRDRRLEPAKKGQRQTDNNGPIERLIEWQEHRYDPGYYTGGNIHPLYAASRPNKYGYILIAWAVMILIVVVLGIRAGAMDWWAVTVSTALMLFLFLVGFKLIRKKDKPAVKTTEEQ
ncbi:MAG TPA: phage holin family protein [Blastocatellia bacterium]|nr:phage holin family protein [Blastocatellia bacterium]